MWPLRAMADKIHEIRKAGNLFFLLNAFIGAYNRRTDVLAENAAEKVAIQELTAKLKASNDKLEAQLKQTNKGE